MDIDGDSTGVSSYKNFLVSYLDLMLRFVVIVF